MDGTYTEQKKVSDQERDVHRFLIKEVMKEARDRARGKKVKGELSIDLESSVDHSYDCKFF